MNRSMLSVVALVCLAVFVTSCSGPRHRDTVRAGILIRDTPQEAFLEVWGPPERTRTFTSDTEEKRLEFSRFGGFYGRSNSIYEVWDYTKRGANLIFYDRKLTGWQTDKTTEELRTWKEGVSR